MTTERMEWVEIVEPRTKEHMYANLTTGQCVWDPPTGVQVKKTDDNQWWELFDQNTSRFYYYNASTQKTVWHRPLNCDIIPLAKLQTLKQNTEARDDVDMAKVKKESVSTQTSSTVGIEIVVNRPKMASIGTQTSPPSPQKGYYNRTSSTTSSPINQPGMRDSGRSSDSSHSLDPRKHESCCSSEGSLPGNAAVEQTWPSSKIGHSPSLQGVDSTPSLHRKHHSDEYSQSRYLSLGGSQDSHYHPDGICTPISNRRPWSRSTDSNMSSPQSPLVPSSTVLETCGAGDSPLSSPHSVESSSTHMSLDSHHHHHQTSPYLKVTHRSGAAKDKHHSRESSKSTFSSTNEQPTPLYNNVDYPSLWDRKPTDNQFYLLPLQHYLLEQAKLSGYKFGEFLGDDLDSLSQSDDSEGHREDEDEFADDEGMSHHDSSSQEYLDDSRYLTDDEDFHLYCEASNLQPSNLLPLNTQHGSLQRNTIYSPLLEKSLSFQQGNRPVSMMASCTTDSGSRVPRMDKKPPSESDIEKYAEDNLNRHKKGIFRKKFTIRDMLAWSKDPISKPMILTTEKGLKRDACDMFKLVQLYMGDRKAKGNQSLDAVALDITLRAWSKPALRDELYIQICRQTTDNPRRESLLLGWELIAISVYFFPPSVKFRPYLESYIKRHLDCDFDTPEFQLSHFARVCNKRLERISSTKRNLKKPTIEEIDQARIQILRPSMFGNTLEEVMDLQAERYPRRKLPWIQTTLSDAVLSLEGTLTEGIFRVPGDIDEVNCMKVRADQWEIIESLDPHVPASLLKLWYRELYEPLIPHDLYEECIEACNDPDVAVAIIQKLPPLNQQVFTYLIRFLQLFAQDCNVAATKMDASNLAMVMAPNCLRCMSDDPRIIFENTRKEMAFMRLLIEHLDTSSVEGMS